MSQSDEGRQPRRPITLPTREDINAALPVAVNAVRTANDGPAGVVFAFLVKQLLLGGRGLLFFPKIVARTLSG